MRDIKNINDEFTDLKELGRGSYGRVYMAKNLKDCSTIVLKQIDKKRVDIDMFTREIDILDRIKKACELYLLCYIDPMQDKDYYYIITEYLDSDKYKTLSDFMIIRSELKLTLNDYKTIIKNLLIGLDQLHENGVVHNDIKPENIMIMIEPPYSIKYIDFGLGCVKNDTICRSWSSARSRGTPLYKAPEKWSYTEDSTNFDVFDSLIKGDIWALGHVIYEFLNGYVLTEIIDIQQRFAGRQLLTKYGEMMRSHFTDKKNFNVSIDGIVALNQIEKEMYTKLVENMLKSNPEERFTLNKCLELIS